MIHPCHKLPEVGDTVLYHNGQSTVTLVAFVTDTGVGGTVSLAVIRPPQEGLLHVSDVRHRSDGDLKRKGGECWLYREELLPLG